MKDRLITAALTLAHVALIGGLAATTMATPAQAQGTLQPVAAEGASCPAGWSHPPARQSRIDTTTCYPTGSQAREVYRRHNGEPCRAGYNTGTSWCEKAVVVRNASSTAGELTKNNKADRCPTGWNTTGNGLTCVTSLKQPSNSRPKAGAKCAANEVDEWGIWCTSNYEGISADTMRGAALRDYNTMYAHNRGVVPAFAGNDLDEKLLTPARRKLYGNVPTKDAPEGNSSSTSSNTSMASANTPSTACDTAAQQGAALGGVVAGTKGKAIGGLAGAAIGGFGKKKKTGC
jgi:hypothetical protein